MIQRLSFLAITLVAFACNNAPTAEKQSSKEKSILADSSSTKENVSIETGELNLNKQVGNEIKLAFAKDKTELTAMGHLDSVNATVICYLQVKQGHRLIATIDPVNNKAGNIRFNLLMLPNGKSDGPFGKTLDYKLKAQGLYQLHIAASKMAENAYKGAFVLKVTIV